MEERAVGFVVADLVAAHGQPRLLGGQAREEGARVLAVRAAVDAEVMDGQCWRFCGAGRQGRHGKEQEGKQQRTHWKVSLRSTAKRKRPAASGPP
ncbi:MAG: hypothetical protein IPG33_01265 [Betaproteobacteria bacterium]|nr:hypothetical protein [Betaproteobacteria bacterium]